MDDRQAATVYALAAAGCNDAEIIAYCSQGAERPWSAIKQARAWLDVVRSDQIERVRSAQETALYGKTNQGSLT